MRILLVEDDEMLGEATAAGLRLAYAVDLVTTAEDAAAALDTTSYDLVALDINLPGESGLSLLKARRAAGEIFPVILLTAQDDVASRIRGLNSGADDYLTKPFDLHELLARIAALIRRANGRASPLLTHGNIVFDPLARVVRRNAEIIPLSARELAVLEILLNNAGRLVSKGRIEEKIYDWQQGVRIESNTVEVHISSLRRKLGRDFITTARGVGYMVAA